MRRALFFKTFPVLPPPPRGTTGCYYVEKRGFERLRGTTGSYLCKMAPICSDNAEIAEHSSHSHAHTANLAEIGTSVPLSVLCTLYFAPAPRTSTTAPVPSCASLQQTLPIQLGAAPCRFLEHPAEMLDIQITYGFSDVSNFKAFFLH
jgi:hypothetical protein